MNQPKAYIFSLNPLDRANDKWDYSLLKEMFDNKKVKEISVSTLPDDDRAFVVITGGGNAGKEQDINKELSKINRVVLFITADECALFDVEKIKHRNISIWIQTPHDKHEKYNRFFLGPASHIKNNIPQYTEKKYDLSFSGQITHQRRQELARIMPRMKNSLYRPTEAFAQGDPPNEYFQNLAASKVVPCPSGAAVVDNFRFFEALEMLALPVGDLKDRSGQEKNYYEYVNKKTVPVPLTNDWHKLPDMMIEIMEDYPANMHKAVAWWIKYKRDFANQIMDHYYAS